MRAAVISGVAWMGSSQVLAQLIHLVVRLVLARLLVPEDFGLLGMAMIFVGVLQLFSDLGMQSAIVNREQLTPGYVSTAFWSMSGMATFLCLVCQLGAPWVADFFQEARLEWIVRIISLSILLSAPASLFDGLHRREFGFRRIGVARIMTTGVSGSIALVLALEGAGVWALVVERVLAAGVLCGLLAFHLPRRVGFAFELSAFKDLWGFTKPLLGARFVRVLTKNLDKIVIGRVLGAGPLGVYMLGYQAVVLPLQYLSRPLASVGISAFSRLQADLSRVRRGYREGVELLAALGWPALALLSVSAPTMVPIVLGEQWMAAIVPIQLFSIAAAADLIASFSSSIFIGLGRTTRSFQWSIIYGGLNILGVVLGIPWGLNGIAIGFAASSLLALLPHLKIVSLTLGVTTSDLLQSLFIPAIGVGGALSGWWIGMEVAQMTGYAVPFQVTIFGLGIGMLLGYGIEVVLSARIRLSVRSTLQAIKAKR